MDTDMYEALSQWENELGRTLSELERVVFKIAFYDGYDKGKLDGIELAEDLYRSM